MRTTSKLSLLGNGLALLAFVSILGWTIVRASDRLVYNWDMLGYMALALEWEEEDPAEVHRRTYAAARERLPERVFGGLVAPVRGVEDGGVRFQRAKDPEAFTEHIAFYRARVLYTLLILGVHKCGAPLADTTWWISLASFGLTALVVLAWVARHVALVPAALVALGLAHSPALIETATFSTADALGTLVTCLGVFLFVERRARFAAAAVLTAAICVRPDAVIFNVFLIAGVFLLEPAGARPSVRFLLGWLAASLLAYFAVQRFSGSYGWWPLFWISFVRKEVHPSRLPTAPDLGVYWEVLSRQVTEALGSPVFVYAALALLGLFLWRRFGERARENRHAVVLGTLLAAYLARYLLFPQLWDRFFAPFYVLVPLLLLSMLSTRLRSPEAQDVPDQDGVSSESAS